MLRRSSQLHQTIARIVSKHYAMKTDVRLRPSWRTLLLLQAALLQHARIIVAQASSTSASYPNTTNSNATSSTPSFSCAPCTVTVSETLLSFPAPVNISTKFATATVIPYVTEYADGTNVTSFSTYSSYAPNASSQNNFTAPSTTPLTWTTLGLTLTYPTTYLAFPSPEAGMNSILAVNSTSYCYAGSLTTLTDLPSASLVFPYNASLFGSATTGLAATITDNTAGQVSAAATLSSAPLFTAASEITAYESIASSLLSFLDGLPQLSSIVGTDPRLCSQTVGGSVQASEALTATSTFNVPTAAFVHTSVAVLTQTGQAVTTTATSVPDTGSGPGNGNGNQNGGGSGGGSNSGGGSGSSGGQTGNSGSGSGSSGNSGSGSGGSGSSGNSGGGSGGSGSGSGSSGNSGNSGGGLGAVVASAAAAYASTAHTTPAPTAGSQQYITVGSSAFVVSAETGNAGGGVVIGGGYATLAPNSGIAINGVPVSYEVSGSTTALVVGGSTISLSVATATAGVEGILTFGGQSITESSGEYVIGGMTLTAGGEIVIGGTTVSLAPGGSVAVINGQTETLATATVSGNTGAAIMSGIGVTGSSASSTSIHSAAAPTIDASGAVIAIIAGVVGALGVAL